MKCTASGKGPIQYIWLKEEPGRRVKIGDGDMDHGVLEFASLSGKDWGRYTCQAQNEEEFVSSNTVSVECEPYKEKGKKLGF